MSKFTLLELHVDDATMSANAPFLSSSAEDEASEVADGEGGTSESDSDGGLPLGALTLGLALVLAVVFWLQRGGGSADIE
ncbi:hypothetical protein BRC91_06355 [Halobacteriales archaeon QS_4_62_28]|nr:MAG: hypothetical protein BRC91_06355 [Halobacteriales archaeon QS_4_62_28]